MAKFWIGATDSAAKARWGYAGRARTRTSCQLRLAANSILAWHELLWSGLQPGVGRRPEARPAPSHAELHGAGGRLRALQRQWERSVVLTFSVQERNRKGGPPTYAPITVSSVVFGLHDATDDLGTEDPRVTYDASSGTHYMFYTCYNSGSTPQPRVTLCLATTADPSSATGWARHRNAHCIQTYGTVHTACTLLAHCMHRCATARLVCLLTLNRVRCC